MNQHLNGLCRTELCGTARCGTALCGVVALVAISACSGGERTRPENQGGGGGSGGDSPMTTAASTVGVGGMALVDLPSSFTVQGIVVDDEGAPVADATVLQGGKSHDLPHFVTGADGSFTINVEYPGYGIPGVVAVKQDYRARGEQFYALPTAPIELQLLRVHPPDNAGYTYGEPGVGTDPSTKYCGHCHDTFAAEFQTSKHAQATKDPIVQDLYAGVTQAFATAASCTAAGGEWKQGLVPGTAADPIAKCYLGGGVLPDLNATCGGAAEPACDDPTLTPSSQPTAFGACADCHAPGINGIAGGRNLHEAVGIPFDNGVHCDVCHKVRDVDLGLPPGVGQRLILQRPNEPFDNPTAEFRPVFFGPLLDVPNGFMGASYTPLFKEATFCAGCHEQKQAALIIGDALDPLRWPDGLPVHSTFSEWLAGPYSQSGTPCQFCHMPANFDLVNTIDLATVDNQSITFGYPRPPEDIRRHIFRSPLHGAPRLIDGALFVSINLAVNAGEVDASVSLANIGCGHAVPTGEPMRALVMLVDAQGEGCAPPLAREPLPPSGGMTVFDVGGARARGVEGQGVSTVGAVMSWPAAAGLAGVGHVVRVVRPTGSFDDYQGVGFFADPSLAPADKGLPILAPVGQATVLGVAAGQLTLSQALAPQTGDVIYLGDPISSPASDGQVSLNVAGASGYAFARVLTDNSGARGVAHHRAVDMASDNRIPPGKNAITTHSFTALAGCTAATVRAVVLYRPLPTAMATLRGWDARDYIIATAQATVALP